MTLLDKKIVYSSGVGSRRALLLKQELGVDSYGDLLLHVPIRYIDRSTIYKIADITHVENHSYIQIRAKVLGFINAGIGRKSRLTVEVADDTGFASMIWFSRSTWAQKALEVGREYIFFGKPTTFNDNLSIVHPEFEIIGLKNSASSFGVEGVYSSTETLNRNWLTTKAISKIVRSVWDEVGSQITDNLPEYLLSKLQLLSRRDALFNVHFPQSQELLSRALFRLKFEEILPLQLGMIQTRDARHSESKGYVFDVVGALFNQFYNEKLDFALTSAQQRVIKEIRLDMKSSHQMNRLLQGDVGSGKTIVALMCSLIAIDNGYQVAIMVPTEILAQQHLKSIEEQCEGLSINIKVLTGSTRKREREKILANLIIGEINLLIGTHALIEDPVQFNNLGFVVIDEQHRFGVQQRSKLWNKSVIPPHILVMTATPIPRTLAMTVYGELDVSKIDELPPGRKPIETYQSKEAQRLRLIGFMKEQIALGRQIYVVFPLIKESEKLDIANLEQGADLIHHHFPSPEYSSVVVHGKMSNTEKEYGMRLFVSGEVNILISTTVIEVGVNIPNASLMIIESAERFGLSQLHQLRGRVGRGAEQSYCVLMCGDKISNDANKRIEAMCDTNDGFELAELDMKIRGSGDLEGTRQSGQSMDLKIANLSKDTEILERANSIAEEILLNDAELNHTLNEPLKKMVELNKQKRIMFDFSKIS